MALVTEDGTGLANAESYISVADADAYHLARGNADWAAIATDQIKEENLRKATEYLDATYSWIGIIKETDQALGWPRKGNNKNKEGVAQDDIVPVPVERACAELALDSSSSELLENTTNANFVTREKVDVIEVEYASGAPSTTQYNFINRLLNGLFIGGNNLVRD